MLESGFIDINEQLLDTEDNRLLQVLLSSLNWLVSSSDSLIDD